MTRAAACRLLLLTGFVLPGATPLRAAEGGGGGMAFFPADAIAFPFREKTRSDTPGADDAAAGGTLRGDSAPLFPATRIAVAAYRLDRRAVTHGEFVDFVRAHPRFGRSRISPALADAGYLRAWRGDLEPPPDRLREPVTGVSWYAAKAYCAAQGKRLPTTAEWERAAATFPQAPTEGRAEDSAPRERAILAWYGSPRGEGEGEGTRHADGTTGLFGKTWEWTADFNAWSGSGVNARGVRAGESRDEEADAPKALTCGGAPAGMLPNTPYATYMRWAFRSSLSPEYTVATLGFRCARNDEGK